MPKANLSKFLSRNPFPRPNTFGFFYREKMRAIHRIAPDISPNKVLEVGGGRSGLTTLLYPEAYVTNIDLNPEFASSPLNRQERMQFVCGDATALPFEDGTFDVVTMFDLLEHVPDDRKAAEETLRVLKPGGYLLVSSPNENWRFPYYRFMKPFCPTEEEMFAEWGHVRRGYSLADLENLIPAHFRKSATFISPVTVLMHDIAFSKLPHRLRSGLCLLVSPLTWFGYHIHKPDGVGTETASAWQKLS